MPVDRTRAAHRAARRISATMAVLAIVAFVFPAATLAHGELVLELGAERIQPGGTIEVRGDLGSGETFEVALISKTNGSRRVIATIPAVEEGHFQSFVTIPADATGGDYLVEVSDDLVVVRAPLTVAGAAIAPEGGGGPEQEEGLIQPLPSGIGAAATAIAAPAETSPRSAPRSPIDALVVVGVAALVAAGLIGGLRLRARRHHVPG